MDLKTVIDSAPTLKKPRRTFTAEFKNKLIQQCQQPDTSVAKVAMQYQINANLLHKWIRQSRSTPPVLTTPSSLQVDFLPIVLRSPPVKEETPQPPVPEKKAPVRIKISPQQSDKLIVIAWHVEPATELLLLIKELAH